MSVPRMSGYLASRKQKDKSVNNNNLQFTEKKEESFHNNFQV